MWIFSEKEKVDYKQIVRLDKKVNHTRRNKVLLKTLDRLYEEISETKTYHLIWYFLFALVFFAVPFIIIYDLLCFIMTNQKLKMMLLIIDLKHGQKQQNKKSNVVVKEELLKSIKESYDEHDPNLGEI